MHENPQEMQHAFLYTESILDCSIVESTFLFGEWSAQGTNRYLLEKSTHTYWRDFLQDLEGLSFCFLLVLSVIIFLVIVFVCRSFLGINNIFYADVLKFDRVAHFQSEVEQAKIWHRIHDLHSTALF